MRSCGHRPRLRLASSPRQVRSDRPNGRRAVALDLVGPVAGRVAVRACSNGVAVGAALPAGGGGGLEQARDLPARGAAGRGSGEGLSRAQRQRAREGELPGGGRLECGHGSPLFQAPPGAGPMPTLPARLRRAILRRLGPRPVGALRRPVIRFDSRSIGRARARAVDRVLEAPRDGIDRLRGVTDGVESAVLAPAGNVGDRLAGRVEAGTGADDVGHRVHDHLCLWAGVRRVGHSEGVGELVHEDADPR